MYHVMLTDEEIKDVFLNEHCLTTIDNPINPMDDYASWSKYDLFLGHHTNEYLDRIALISEDMTDFEKELEYRRAMKEIVVLNPIGIYKIVSTKRETPLTNDDVYPVVF